MVLIGYVGGGGGFTRVGGGVVTGAVIGDIVGRDGGVNGVVAGTVGTMSDDFPNDVILISCASVASVLGNEMLTADCTFCDVAVFSTL